MATKDNQPGLFSKMASFVLGNGTKEKAVSVLPDSVQDSTQESVYDKATLKAIIERKRHNDLIRKHEFDTLRKLRNSNVVVTASQARPSVFQASVPSDLEGRADTLKKIDEIEAQMSRQWWKGRQEVASKSTPAVPPVVPSAAKTDAPVTSNVHFDKTIPYEHSAVSTAVVLDGFRATEALNVPQGRQSMPVLQEPDPAPLDTRTPDLGIDLDFGVVEPRPVTRHPPLTAAVPGSEATAVALAVNSMETDPELDEAAILYANGDAAAAEHSLLHALQSSGAVHSTGLAWFAALLDLFRATNNRARFEAVVQLFPQYAGSVSPSWYTAHEHAVPAHNLVETARVSDAMWECPVELTVSSLEMLKQAVLSQPQPWRLGWSRLVRIEPDAMPLLGAVMRKFCDEPVQLQFIGAERLVHVLAAMTPTMESAIAPAWWLVRLNVLRVVQLYDDFENTALDYCVTFEVSPPAWEPAKCRYENVMGVQVAALPSLAVDAVNFASEVPQRLLPDVPDGAIELTGEVLGDALDALEKALRTEAGDMPVYRNDIPLVVYCSHLLRVDFSAAGSILNWAAMRQSEGCTVQFRDVNRMVAAFFHVIGINEHAQIIPSPMV